MVFYVNLCTQMMSDDMRVLQCPHDVDVHLILDCVMILFELPSLLYCQINI